MDYWAEYDNAAEWCARNLSTHCISLIAEDPEAFAQRVREMAYEMSMAGMSFPEEAR